MKKYISLFVLFFIANFAHAASDHLIEFRLVCEETQDDCEKYFEPNLEQDIWINKEVLLKDSDIKKVELEQSAVNKENVMLILTFNDRGSKKLQEVTASNTGKRLAMFIMGAFHSASKIRESIAGERVYIGEVGVQEANQIAATINADSNQELEEGMEEK